MTDVTQIRDSIRKIAGFDGLGSSFFTAQVKSVSETDCSVMYGTMEITGVKLFSIDAAGKLLIKPKKGSMVTVADLSAGKLRDLVIIKADQVELIRYNQDGLIVEIDSVSKKVDISNASTSLTKIMEALHDLLQSFKVLTPQGPSEGLQVDTMTSLEQFQTTFKQLLK
ncbi:MAG: hypothetical protein WCO44_12385 [Bacteroidota bacterium]